MNYGRDLKSERFSYFTFTPKPQSLAKMTKFASADRFEKPDKDLDLPYKSKVAESKPSDFEVEEPKGLRFGKERVPVAEFIQASLKP